MLFWEFILILPPELSTTFPVGWLPSESIWIPITLFPLSKLIFPEFFNVKAYDKSCCSNPIKTLLLTGLLCPFNDKLPVNS